MKYIVTVKDSQGNPISEETVNGLGAVEEVLYVMNRLAAREDFRYTLDIELMPETKEDINELRDRFM